MFQKAINTSDEKAILEALSASQATIEFTPNGEIITANQNFLSALGYTLSEIIGKHHRIFCDPKYTATSEYQNFWNDLAAGRFNSNEFKRFSKNGQVVWIQASYNPVRNSKGEVVKVVKFASDITKAKLQSIDFAGKIEAIDRAQAVIEFTPNGEILTANSNFCGAVGYSLDEIKGKHHRMFCEPQYAASHDYSQFWDNLRAGKFQAAEYKRIGKGGKEIYIQASYNPIFDDTGAVVKVVKFATDITETVLRRIRNEQLSTNINDDLGQVVNQVVVANEMTEKAAVASTETGAIVNSVAAASEELSQSVREIAASMTNARAGAEGATMQAANANQSADELSKSAAAMNSIVTLIQDIAKQINMLALNATIESARAGEAGRGFAVVASEVKNLANQATASTQTISAEINRMQVISDEVVNSLSAISSSMNGVMDNVSAVAASIEQQNAVTLDISQNMQQAVVAVNDISFSLEQINSTFNTVSEASEKVKKDVETLVA